MRLTQLTLKDFRNHQNQTLWFEAEKVVFCGANGQGKTNFLEAISLLSLGKSWRETSREALIRHGETSSLLKAKTLDAQHFGVQLTPKSQKFTRNEKPLSRAKFFGQIPTLLFCPEFSDLFLGSKTARNNFFDRFLLQVYPRYREALLRANKAHKHKTRLLKQTEGLSRQTKTEIAPWNQILAENLPTIWELRQEFLQAINPYLCQELFTISGKEENIQLQLQPAHLCAMDFESILEFFEQNYRLETLSQRNSLAPHRDDWQCQYHRRPLSQTASRGENRSILLALIAAQKHLLQTVRGTAPILLLDDVFSELDAQRQSQLAALASGCQTFYTTTHPGYFADFEAEVQVINV